MSLFCVGNCIRNGCGTMIYAQTFLSCWYIYHYIYVATQLTCIFFISGNRDRSFERTKEGEVLRVMTSTVNVAISKQSDPVRFADAAYSAGFISEELKMDSMSATSNDYGKVSKVMFAVMTHIKQQSEYGQVCRKFDRFILLLCDELKMKDLAKQLVDKLCELVYVVVCLKRMVLTTNSSL